MRLQLRMHFVHFNMICDNQFIFHLISYLPGILEDVLISLLATLAIPKFTLAFQVYPAIVI